jgi:hypothetical protein
MTLESGIGLWNVLETTSFEALFAVSYNGMKNSEC